MAKKKKLSRKTLGVLLLAELSLLVAASFVAETWSFVTIAGHSMEPTLSDGQVVLGKRVDVADPIVIGNVYLVSLGETSLVKRLVAGPGDLVEYHDGEFYLNGSPSGIRPEGRWDTFSVKLLCGEYFALGDNLAESVDSRVLGNHIIHREGVVLAICQ